MSTAIGGQNRPRKSQGIQNSKTPFMNQNRKENKSEMEHYKTPVFLNDQLGKDQDYDSLNHLRSNKIKDMEKLIQKSGKHAKNDAQAALSTVQFENIDDQSIVTREEGYDMELRSSAVEKLILPSKLDYIDIDHIYYGSIEDHDKTTKPNQYVQPPEDEPIKYSFQQLTHDQFYQRLKQDINKRSPYFWYDDESNKFSLLPRDADAYCRKQYSMRCSCKLCRDYIKQEQCKDDYKTLYAAKDDEEAFQKFIKLELNKDGFVKKALEREQRNIERADNQQGEVRIDYLRDLQSQKKGILKKTEHYVFKEKDFNWLMEKLVSPKPDKLCGCQVNIPETVLIENSKPKCFLKTEKDGCVVSFMKSKLTLTNAKNYFAQLNNERYRMRENDGIDNLLQNQSQQNKQDVSPPPKAVQNSEQLSPEPPANKGDNEQYQSQTSGSLAERRSGFQGLSPDLRRQKLQEIEKKRKNLLQKIIQSQNSSSQCERYASQVEGQLPHSSDQSGQKPTLKQKGKEMSETKKNDNKVNLKEQFYEERFIFRYTKESQRDSHKKYQTEEPFKIFTESDFQSEFQKIRNSDYWKTVTSIQMTPQNKIGLGKYFTFTFSPLFYEKDQEYASNQKQSEKDERQQIIEQMKIKDPYDPNLVLNRISKQVSKQNQSTLTDKLQGNAEYNWRQFGCDDIALQKNHPESYCMKVCQKIGYYFQQIHQIEIIRMQCEFYQDETDKIEFYNAKKIWIRCLESNKILRKKGETLDIQQDNYSEIEQKSTINYLLSHKDDRYKNHLINNLKAKEIKKVLETLTENLNSYDEQEHKSDLIQIMADLNHQLDVISKNKKQKQIVEQVLKEVEENQKNQEYMINDQANVQLSQRSLNKLGRGQQYSKSVQNLRNKYNLQSLQPEIPNYLKSALDKIGNLGEIESRIKPYNGDFQQYQQEIVNKYSQTQMLFHKNRIHTQQHYPQNTMLDWMRNQQGRQGFLIPMLKQEDKVINLPPPIVQRNQKQVISSQKKITLKQLKPDFEDTTTPAETTMFGQVTRQSSAEQFGTRTLNTANNQGQFSKSNTDIRMISDRSEQNIKDNKGLLSNINEREYENEYYMSKTQTGQFLPRAADQALTYASKRPMMLKEEIIQNVNMMSTQAKLNRKIQTSQTTRIRTTVSPFSQRIHRRIQYKADEKEQAGIKESQPQLYDNPRDFYTFGGQPTYQSASQLKQLEDQNQQNTEEIQAIEEMPVKLPEQQVTNKSITRNASLLSVGQFGRTSIKEQASTIRFDTSLKRKESQKTQKQLELIRRKIRLSHRELEKNNVYAKLKFELKDPNQFKEFLGIRRHLAEDQPSPQSKENEKEEENYGFRNAKESLFNPVSQINVLMDHEQRQQTEMNMVNNLHNNMFMGGKHASQRLRDRKSEDNRGSFNVHRGTKTPDQQLHSKINNSNDQKCGFNQVGKTQTSLNTQIENNGFQKMNYTENQTDLQSTQKTEKSQTALTVGKSTYDEVLVENRSSDNLYKPKGKQYPTMFDLQGPVMFQKTVHLSQMQGMRNFKQTQSNKMISNADQKLHAKLNGALSASNLSSKLSGKKQYLMNLSNLGGVKKITSQLNGKYWLKNSGDPHGQAERDKLPVKRNPRYDETATSQKE